MAFIRPGRDYVPSVVTGGGGGGGGNDGTAPTYITALSDYQVAKLTSASNGNVNLNDTMPLAWQGATGIYGSNANVTAAYSGGCWDSIGAIAFIHGGGHSDSANNGIWKYDFNGTTTPTGWTLLDISPSTGSVSQDTDPTSTSPDRPVSIHTYAGLAFDPDTNKVFRFAGGQWSSGGMPTKNWAFSVSPKTWAQTQNTPYASTNPVASIIDDISRKILVVAHSGDWWFYRIDTNTTGAQGSNNQQAFDSVAAYDPTRGVAMIWAPSEMWKLVIDWVAETVTWSAQSTSGSTGIIASGKGGFFYDADSDRYWLFPLVSGSSAMANVYDMTPAGVITSHATSGTNSGFSTDGWTGSYNKICPMLQWRAVGFITGINDAAYVVKLPII